MMMRLLAALCALGTGLVAAPARADGLQKAGPADVGQCIAPGAPGLRVPCMREDQAWIQVLRPTDDISGAGVRAQSWSPGLPTFARPLGKRAGDALTVRDTGAVADGKTDDHDAFQNPAHHLGIAQVPARATRPDGTTVQIRDYQPTLARPGGHIRVPTGQYLLKAPVFTQPGVGLELDTGACFVGNSGSGGNPALPDLLAPAGNGGCYAVKTLAGYATSALDGTVLLLAQTQATIPTVPGVVGLPGQQQALMIQQLVANTNPATAGAVGFEVQQKLVSGVTRGSLWGGHVLTRIDPGQEPYAVLAEFEIDNRSGLVQPKVGAASPAATIGLNVNNLGDTVSTAALTFSGQGGWRYASLCAQPAIRVWCLATVDGAHNPVAGTTVDGKTHAQSFGIGTATAAENGNGTVALSGVATFARSDGAGGVALAASSVAVQGTPVETAWEAYTPTIRAASGTLGANALEGGYKQIGKTVHFRAQLSVTSNGTGAGALYLGVPVAAKAATYVGGVEQAAGNGLAGIIQPGQSAAILKTAAGGGYPLSGRGPWLVVVSGTYEAR